MSQRRSFAALCAVLIAVAAAPALRADDKVELKWKFKTGDVFYQKMYTKTEQTMKVLNNDVKQTQEQTFYFSWTVGKNDGDNWEVTQKITGVQMNIDLGGSKISYDSVKGADNPNNALADFFKALVGSEFKLTLKVPKEGAVTVDKIEGRKEFLDKLVQANTQMKPLLETILSEEALKQMAAPTFNALPNKTVAPKDTWPATSTLDMGPIGKYVNTFTYTYDGKDDKEKKLDKISVKTDLKYTPPDEKTQVGGLPFRIKSADLKSKDASGTILVDADKGRIEKTTMQLTLTGQLSIEIGGQPTQVDLSQTQNTTVETSDKSQLPEKAPADKAGPEKAPK